MAQDTIIILGIPVDNLTMNEAVSFVFGMLDAYAADGRPRLVATVNVDFVVNTLTWRLGRIRHPELIDILRRADLVTADGMPIVWMSRLLGVPLKERVTGADLVPKLAESAAGREKSIFFLGGKGDVGQKAADLLKERFPDLKMAGVYSPFVHVDGEAMALAEEEDEHIVAAINRSNADILLIAFGNPKQELWFDRNRHRLKVPVSIGIGGTYEFIVGSVSRAPKWMQKTGLEWVFRITQDPKRLIKRYFLGLLKFGAMVWPAILYYRYRRLRYRRSPTPKAFEDSRPVPKRDLSEARDAEIRFPERLDAFFLENSRDTLEAHLASSESIVLNFGDTRFIDSSGLGFIVKLWNRDARKGEGLYLVGVRPEVIRLFKLNRLWDLFSSRVFDEIPEGPMQIEDTSSGGYDGFVLERGPGFVTVKFFRRLDVLEVQRIDADALFKDIGAENCILNLDGIDFVDSSGLGLLIKILKHVSRAGRACYLCNLSENVKQMLLITKVMPLFRVLKDTKEAERELQKNL